MFGSDIREAATRTGRLIILAALIWAAGVVWVTLGRDQGSVDAAEAPKRSEPKAADPIARGEYLVTIAGCNDCHTPLKMTEQGPAPDMSRILSGHPRAFKLPAPPKPDGAWMWSGSATNTAFAGPWGVTYAPNLTPDPLTGLGIWTEEMFMKALRTGRHFGEARPIQPPMPWFNFARMTDDDLKAVYAYLRSIPPVRNLVPDYQPPNAE